jgi:hypothetical protein
MGVGERVCVPAWLCVGGAGCVCRALTITHIKVVFFAVRLSKDALQRPLCRAFFNRAHGKQFFQKFYKIHKIIL